MLLTRTSHVSPATQSDFQSQTLGRQLEAGEPDPCSGRGSRSRAHGRPGATFGPHSPSSWLCRLLHPSPPVLEGRDCPCSDVNSEQGAWGRYEENSVGIGGGRGGQKAGGRGENATSCAALGSQHTRTHTHAPTCAAAGLRPRPAGRRICQRIRSYAHLLVTPWEPRVRLDEGFSGSPHVLPFSTALPCHPQTPTPYGLRVGVEGSGALGRQERGWRLENGERSVWEAAG